MALTDSTSTMLKIAITHTPSPASLANLDSVNQQLCHLKVNLLAFNLTSLGAAFDTLAMANMSEYKSTPEGLEAPYDIIRVSGLRSYDITYQLAFDSTTTSYVTTQYGTFQAAQDTIIFDIQATSLSGLDLFDGDPIISYNTSAFGSYVSTNGILTCTTTADTSDYTFLVADYSSSAFQIHLDANEDDAYDDDMATNAPSIIGIAGYPQTLATCKLTLQNCCSEAHITVTGGTGYYAYYDTAVETGPYDVSTGAGFDTSGVCFANVPVFQSFSPPSINAGTFDTLTINGFGFGCTQGQVWFTNAQQSQAQWMVVPLSDFISWSDNQIQLIVASCVTDYKDHFTPASGPITIVNAANLQNTVTPNLNIGYAVLNNRLPSGRACRLGLWGVDSGSVIPHNEYTVTPDVTITNNPPALVTLTHAMSDWVCETGVRFTMGTPVGYNLTQNDSDFTNSIFFGSVSGDITGAVCFVTPSPPCANSNGDTVEVIVDEDYIFDGTLLQQYLSYPWFLGDTSAIPDTIAPNLGYLSLLGVAPHEFGHGMGLRHVLNPIDLLYPGFAPDTCKVIHYDDQQGGIYELATVGTYLRPCFTPNPQYQSLVCTSSTVGIANVGSTYNIIAYPNPFDETITIDADIGAVGVVKIDLYNILGQIIVSNDCGIVTETRFQKIISTAGLSTGVYLLKVSANTTTEIFKLVKN